MNLLDYPFSEMPRPLQLATNQEPIMKPHSSAGKHCAKLVIAMAAIFAVSNVYACKKHDVICKSKKAVNKAADDTKKEADKAAADAKAAADKAAAEKAAAEKAAAEAKAAADKAAAEAKAAAEHAAALAAQGAAISNTEMKAIVANAKNVYADSTGAMTAGYNAAVNKCKAWINAALEAIWRAAGKSFVNKNSAFIMGMKHRAQHLDANGQAALNRVKRAIGAKRIDDQARADMQLLTSEIAFAGKDIGSAVTHSSFGIQFCESAGAGNVGGESCYMMIMQTYLENGKYRVALARSFGVAASPVPSDVGADAAYGIFWGPGGIDANNGPSMGLGLGVVLDEGMEVGVAWGVPTTIPNPSAVVPGFAISIGGGAKGEAALTAGYTQVLVKI
jgi:hypothetical protein